MTDHLPGDTCPACIADADQRAALLIEVRNICTLWAEAGYFASLANDPAAAAAAAGHLLATFNVLPDNEKMLLVNYVFVNTVALGVRAEGGQGDWLESLGEERRSWMAQFVASGGVDCNCSVPHAPLTSGGAFYSPHPVDVDGEPV